jgi:hypothetical protein
MMSCLIRNLVQKPPILIKVNKAADFQNALSTVVAGFFGWDFLLIGR